MSVRVFQRMANAFRSLAFIRLVEWPRFLAYRRGFGRRETSFRVRGISVPLCCRPGTTDALTIDSVFRLRNHLPPKTLDDDATILDLGANVGYVAADLATIYPKARIIAVELDDENAELASRNLAPFHCEVVNAGIWIDDGTISYDGNREDAFKILGDGTKSGRAVTITSLLDERGIERVDYVKMDIEGAEWDLFNSPGWLDRVDAISVEIHKPEWLPTIESILRRNHFNVSRSQLHWCCLVAYRPEI
jgi:FkbM family methyltransferase